MDNLGNKVILAAAPTGAWPSKKDTPYIPLQPEEIADDVYACWQAGASIAHIHVGDDDDRSSRKLLRRLRRQRSWEFPNNTLVFC